MKTMNVYFDIPTEKCTVLVEVYVSNYSAEDMKNDVSKMMDAEAIAIDSGTYRKLKKKYGD